MGGKSTSHSAVLGSDTTQLASYDLRSWQGLTRILSVAKESLSDAQAYAEFRNLVLEYAQKGGEEDLRKKIDAIVKTFGTAPATHTPTPHTPQVQEKPKEKKIEVISEHAEHDNEVTEVADVEAKIVETASSVVKEEGVKNVVPGRGRIVPHFIPRAMQNENAQAPAPVNLPVETEEVPAVPEMSKEDVVVAVASEVLPEKEELSISVAEPILEKETPSVSVAYEEKPRMPEYASMDEYKARIAEIKRTVHERMGNPAALMDTHNEVGKRYMVALLTALKATGAGSEVGIQSAMMGLEKAYQDLLDHTVSEEVPEALPEVVADVPVSIPVQTVTEKEVVEVSQEPEREPEESPLDEVLHAPVLETQEESDTASEVEDIVSSEPEPKPEVFQPEPEKHGEALEPLPQRRSPASILASFKDADAQVDAFINTPPEERDSVLVDALSKQESEPDPTRVSEDVVHESVSKPTSDALSISDSAEEKMLQTPPPITQPDVVDEAVYGSKNEVPMIVETHPEPVTREPLPIEVIAEERKHSPSGTKVDTRKVSTESPYSAQSIRTTIPVAPPSRVATQTELSNPEITNALHGLLHEWSLFSGSGILGIGPGGPEHPLYRKLSMLSMGEVLAGRFEKADAKVVKTIKEYVDAWRHEQGIAYTTNETFEHFLRRVVQRILKRQKGSE